MSGHSKWSTIKRKKGAADAKRGAIFTRLAREIALAARVGGGDPESNFSLRIAVDKARGANMPKDNIERAIKRGTGEGKDSVAIEEMMYEGYAPHGIALIIHCVTDNRNRTVADVRHILNRYGGSMGETGSVAWQFTKTAYFSFPSEGLNQDEVFMLAVEAGADDVIFDDETVEIVGPVEAYKTIGDQIRHSGIQIEGAGLRMIPNQDIELATEETLKVMKLIEALEDLDDVQDVYSNLNISDAALEQLETA
jgi:YebC/PmpR family DNA-binding regulatory protein